MDLGKTLFKVKVERNITEETVYNLLCSAFEGGSNYWYDELEPLKRSSKATNPSDRFYEDMIKHGFTLMDKHTGVLHTVKPLQFKSAFKHIFSNKDFSHIASDISNDNMDADTGDVFLQTVVFKDVIYG